MNNGVVEGPLLSLQTIGVNRKREARYLQSRFTAPSLLAGIVNHYLKHYPWILFYFFISLVEKF
jgi:hypothetical protein